MPVTVGIIRERADTETRVAATPETVKKMVAAGASVIIERGAGESSAYPDSAYGDAGAILASSPTEVLAASDLVLSVQAPAAEDLKDMKKGTVLAGFAAPYQRPDLLEAARVSGISLLAMEMVPRITRAQAMDALSSQSSLAGYRAVLEAAGFYKRALPMMMTAAGTVAAAKLFVMGAGVAGLQAIATGRRLGAIVSATDVRRAAAEQVESLGARFVMVNDDETAAAETAGGYAREMSDDFRRKQAELIAATISKQDIVITTALIPGKPAPRLVTAAMVDSMRPGSVIIDMAASQGGNCELTVPGEVVIRNGVTLAGFTNIASRIPADASALYARNLLSLFMLILNKDTGGIALNLEDEILKGMTLTHDGAIVHPQFATTPVSSSAAGS